MFGKGRIKHTQTEILRHKPRDKVNNLSFGTKIFIFVTNSYFIIIQQISKEQWFSDWMKVRLGRDHFGSLVINRNCEWRLCLTRGG